MGGCGSEGEYRKEPVRKTSRLMMGLLDDCFRSQIRVYSVEGRRLLSPHCQGT